MKLFLRKFILIFYTYNGIHEAFKTLILHSDTFDEIRLVTKKMEKFSEKNWYIKSFFDKWQKHYTVRPVMKKLQFWTPLQKKLGT